MSAANIPRNLQYDQTNQSTLAEFLVAKQAPEGRSSSFRPDEKIDFRIPTSGGYVDSFASSTLDFDLDLLNTSAIATNTASFDGFLGAHQMISRIVVTGGGNIVEDTTNYPLMVKSMKALHGNPTRMQIDRVLSEESAVGWIPSPYGASLVNWVSDDIDANKVARYKVRLNLMSILGSLSCSKYFPSALLDSDIRLEIYLNTEFRGMIKPAAVKWTLNNVELTLTRVRLNTTVLDALKNSAKSGGLKMVMPGFSHFQETISGGAAGSQVSHITKYSSSASSLKSILVSFRDTSKVASALNNSYAMVDPIGLEYQFLIGSTLMPARPIISSVDKYREIMRCAGGPMNSLTQTNLLTGVTYLRKQKAAAYLYDAPVACHMIGQSLEMYADHTLSSIVFSGLNAINLTMQCHLRMTFGAAEEDKNTGVKDNIPDNRMTKLGDLDEFATNINTSYYVDSVLVFDRLINFNGSEITMGY